MENLLFPAGDWRWAIVFLLGLLGYFSFEIGHWTRERGFRLLIKNQWFRERCEVYLTLKQIKADMESNQRK